MSYLKTDIRSQIRCSSQPAGHNSGTDISVRRSALVAHSACREGLKFFDSIVRASKKKRGSTSTRGRLDMRFTNAHAVWLAIEEGDFYNFVTDLGLIPPAVWKSIDLSGVTLPFFQASDVYMVALEGSNIDSCGFDGASFVSFDRAHATGCLDLSGEVHELTARSAVFAGSIGIDLARVSDCDFTSARAWCLGTTLASLTRVKFDRATFTVGVNFNQVSTHDVTFVRTEFQTDCSFKNVQLTDVSFERALFSGNVFFECCTFVGCDFSGATFAGNVEFSSCVFLSCTFDDATVRGTATGLPTGLRRDPSTCKIVSAKSFGTKKAAKKVAKKPAKKSAAATRSRR